MEDEVDTQHAQSIPKSLSDKLCDAIVRVEIKSNIATGFFMKARIKGIQNYFLLTNYHVISQSDVDQKEDIIIYINESNSELKKIIKLDKNKRLIKCFDKPKDVTLIEILKEDNINEDKYLIPDLNYKNEGFKDYVGKNFFLGGYPNSYEYPKEPHISSGKIDSIMNYFEFNHSLDTGKGSSGSPICLINKFIIGIHKAGNKEHHLNFGTFIGAILDELENNGKIYLEGRKNQKDVRRDSKKKFNEEIEFITKCPFCDSNDWIYWHHVGCPYSYNQIIDTKGKVKCDCGLEYHLLDA